MKIQLNNQYMYLDNDKYKYEKYKWTIDRMRYKWGWSEGGAQTQWSFFN